ncbi:MAG: AAA family ATPase [Candidatus Omnitrophica bacterium]|nr:AAA family ATPase [Candidatus Omnitrophota bacterium]
MYFRKLELCGFKSFADKTVLDFEPGITAVVGPNGCGKSNIFDSIRWVLGEQSVKELRGSKMEDVIFNGSDTKPNLGMAEVSLSFSNESKALPVDSEEVVITRRLFRSGESEYLLNSTQVRLKDIQEIFMGTGIGAESYSLIQQGKIDLILSSRPEDRRLVFDEASGITKYKSQKREAMRKLEDTEQNLLRLNDIVTEVNRQITSLERQANKARRYREVFDELKGLELKLGARQFSDLNGQQLQVRLSASQSREEYAVKSAQMQEISSGLEEHNSRLRQLEERISSLKDKVVSMDNTIERDRQMIAVDTERIEELRLRAERLAGQRAQIELKAKDNKQRLDDFEGEFSKRQAEIEGKKALRSEAERLLDEIASKVKVLNDGVSAAKEKIIGFAGIQVRLRNESVDADVKAQNTFARKRRLELERAKLAQEKSGVEEALAAVALEARQIQGRFDEINSRVSSSVENLNNEKAMLKRLEEEIISLEKDKMGLESQREFLEKLKLKYEDISETHRAVLLLDKLPQEEISGFLAKVGSVSESDDAAGGFSFRAECEAKPIPLGTKEITEKIDAMARNIASLQNACQEKRLFIEALENELSNHREDLHSQEVSLIDKKSQQTGIREQLDKLNSEKELLDFEHQDTEKELAGLKLRQETLGNELKDVENQLKEQNDLIASSQELMLSLGFKREEHLLQFTQLKSEIDSLTRSMDSENETLRMLRTTYEQDRQALGAAVKEIEEAAVKQEELASQIKSMQEEIGRAQQERQTDSALIEDLREQFKLLDGNLIEDRKRHAELAGSVEELSARMHKYEMADQEINFKKGAIKERMLQAYKVDIDTLPVAEGDAPLDMEECVQKIEALKKRVDSYGSVNLVAIEEYDELKTRYDFLIQQQADLVSAKDSLHEAILKINRTTRKMFLDTFSRITEEFRNYFKVLFSGGDAQLFLLDENDPLESGIEIVARPPGKKLQNVLLLSGGEKSMTAIALIFAIFKVNPSPFCVLDEIDAALDEANVDRFSRVLQEFSKASQFIVITHNKKTIANAGVMYGITMEESGVSKIVSVKFSENDKKAAAVSRVRRAGAADEEVPAPAQ